MTEGKLRVRPTVSPIENNFKSHALDQEGMEKLDQVRNKCKELAELIEDIVPNSREKSVAFTNLEQVMFWSNAGISRDRKSVV